MFLETKLLQQTVEECAPECVQVHVSILVMDVPLLVLEHVPAVLEHVHLIVAHHVHHHALEDVV